MVEKKKGEEEKTSEKGGVFGRIKSSAHRAIKKKIKE
jgi:hypothetical protein